MQDCQKLETLDALANLRVIEGTADDGLRIVSNPLLQHLGGLAGLTDIYDGGVLIMSNENLCYADLFSWSRLFENAPAYANNDVAYFQYPERCLALQCDATCGCGWCAGPAKCSARCRPSKAWIAAPVVCSLLLAAALVWLVVACIRGTCACRCRVSRAPLLRPEVAFDDSPAKQQPDVWTNNEYESVDRSTLCVCIALCFCLTKKK